MREWLLIFIASMHKPATVAHSLAVGIAVYVPRRDGSVQGGQWGSCPSKFEVVHFSWSGGSLRDYCRHLLWFLSTRSMAASLAVSIGRFKGTELFSFWGLGR